MPLDREDLLAGIYERGDGLRRQHRRRFGLVSGAAALVVATVLGASLTSLGDDAGDPVTAGDQMTVDQDGRRSSSTPRGDDAVDSELTGKARTSTTRPGEGSSRRVAPSAAEADDAGRPSSSSTSTTSSTTIASGSTDGAVAAASTPCRNSTDPACGAFYYDPPLPPNEPAVITIEVSPAKPQVGDEVMFTVVVSDPDGSRLGCETFDPDVTDLEAKGSDGLDHTPRQSTCGGTGKEPAPQTTIGRYGPWDPPTPTATRHEVRFTATYHVSGKHVARYETTEVGRCEGDAPCPTRSKEIELTVQ